MTLLALDLTDVGGCCSVQYAALDNRDTNLVDRLRG